jgi:hypothetical protein
VLLAQSAPFEISNMSSSVESAHVFRELALPANALAKPARVCKLLLSETAMAGQQRNKGGAPPATRESQGGSKKMRFSNTGSKTPSPADMPRSGGSRGKGEDDHDEDVNALFEKQRQERYAAERREKELRHDPNYEQGTAGEEGDDDDDHFGAYVDEAENVQVKDGKLSWPDEEDDGDEDDDLPPPPKRK